MLQKHFFARQHTVKFELCEQVRIGGIAHNMGTYFYVCTDKCEIMGEAPRLNGSPQPGYTYKVRGLSIYEIGG